EQEKHQGEGEVVLIVDGHQQQQRQQAQEGEPRRRRKDEDAALVEGDGARPGNAPRQPPLPARPLEPAGEHYTTATLRSSCCTSAPPSPLCSSGACRRCSTTAGSTVCTS